jgi:DNA-binding transcriptional ArsR family regulator
MPPHIPDDVLELMAEKFRMLSDPTRLAILRCLMAGERNVGQVVAETGQGQANVSKHLRLLADAGLIRRRKAGLQVHYAIADPLIDKLCRLVCDTIQAGLRQEVERNRALLDQWSGDASRPAPRARR